MKGKRHDPDRRPGHGKDDYSERHFKYFRTKWGTGVFSLSLIHI